MAVNTLRGNIAATTLAQVLSTLQSLLVALALPKILGVEHFAYWQLFMLYISFAGVFHLGLNDGVYLASGRRAPAGLNRKTLQSGLIVSLALTLCTASIVAIVLSSQVHGTVVFVVWASAIQVVVANALGYLVYVLHASMRSTLASLVLGIGSTVSILAILIAALARVRDVEVFIVIAISSSGASLFSAALILRAITTTAPYGWRRTRMLAYSALRSGWPLMLANLANIAVLGFPRLIVERNWDLLVFGQVSFAISIVLVFQGLMTQVGLVIFPALRTSDGQAIARGYRRIRSFAEVAPIGIYLLSIPAAEALIWWLPEYEVAVHYLRILLPTFSFLLTTNLVDFNYLKVFKKQKWILSANVATTLIITVLSLLFAWSGFDIASILLTLVVALGLRSLFGDLACARVLDTGMNSGIWLPLILAAVVVASELFVQGNWATVTLISSVSLYAITRLRSIRHLFKA